MQTNTDENLSNFIITTSSLWDESESKMFQGFVSKITTMSGAVSAILINGFPGVVFFGFWTKMMSSLTKPLKHALYV